jgi:hypothetical protein
MKKSCLDIMSGMRAHHIVFMPLNPNLSLIPAGILKGCRTFMSLILFIKVASRP